MNIMRVVAMCLLAFAMVGCDSSSRDWSIATQANTIAAYRDFTEKHPKAPQTAVANEKINDLVWQASLINGTPQALKDFIASFPSSSHVNEAKGKLEEREWKDAIQANTIAGMKEFLAAYPNSERLSDATARLTALSWNLAATEKTVSAFVKYFEAYDADAEALNKVAAILNDRDFHVFATQLKDKFGKVLLATKDPSLLEDAVVRVRGFKFAADGVERIEQLLSDNIAAASATGRTALPGVAPAGGVPPSKFSAFQVDPTKKLAANLAMEIASDFLVMDKVEPGDVLVQTEFPNDRVVFPRWQGRIAAGRGTTNLNISTWRWGVGTIIRFSGSHVFSKDGVSATIVGVGEKLNRLTFVLTSDGLVYVRGKGRIEFDGGKTVDLPLAPATKATGEGKTPR